MLQIEVLGKYTQRIEYLTNGSFTGGLGTTAPSGWFTDAPSSNVTWDSDRLNFLNSHSVAVPLVHGYPARQYLPDLPSGSYSLRFDILSMDAGMTIYVGFHKDGAEIQSTTITTAGNSKLFSFSFNREAGAIYEIRFQSRSYLAAIANLSAIIDNASITNSNPKSARGFLNLFPDTKASFVIDNYALNRDSSNPGEYSLPISLPRGGINDVLLSFFHELPQNSRHTQFWAKVYYGGIQLYSGVLQINSSTSDAYSGHIKVSVAGLTCLDKNLRDLDYGIPIPLGPDLDTRLNTITDIINAPHTDYPVWFPTVCNQKFYSDKNPNYRLFVNLFDPGTNTIVKPKMDPAYIEAVQESPIVPYVYEQFILKKGFETDKINTEGEFFDDTELQQLLIHNNVELHAVAEKYRVEAEGDITVHADPPNAIGNFKTANIPLNIEVDDPDSAFNPLTYEYEAKHAGWHSMKGTISFEVFNNFNPFGDEDTIKIEARVYKNGSQDPSSGSIQQIFFFNPTFGNYTKEYSLRFYVDNADVGSKYRLWVRWSGFPGVGTTFTYELDFNAATAVIRNDSLRTFNELPDEIVINNHVPDMSFGEFVDRIVKAWNIGLKFDLLNRRIVFDFAQTGLNATSVDITEKVVPDYEILEEKVLYKRLNYEPDDTDDLYEEKTDHPLVESELIGQYTTFDLLPTDASVKTGDIAFVKNQLRFFIAAVDGTTGVVSWSSFSIALPDIIVDKDGDIEVLPACAGMFIARTDDPISGRKRLTPYIQQEGYAPQFGLKTATFGLRQVFRRGWQPMADGTTQYPMASSGNINELGTTIGDRTLFWVGEGGLYATQWESWILALHNADHVNLKVNFNIIDLLTFDISKKVRFKSRSLMVKSWKYDVGEVIEPGTLECVLLK